MSHTLAYSIYLQQSRGVIDKHLHFQHLYWYPPLASELKTPKAHRSIQARSCLYASTQLNPHYFDKNNFLFKKMWFEIQSYSSPFYAKINGFSLVKKALRKPQIAPNCTIYFKIFRGGGCPLTPLHYFESTFFIGYLPAWIYWST